MRNTMIKMNNNTNSDLYIDKVIVIFEEELENCISSKKRRNKMKKKNKEVNNTFITIKEEIIYQNKDKFLQINNNNKEINSEINKNNKCQKQKDNNYSMQ